MRAIIPFTTRVEIQAYIERKVGLILECRKESTEVRPEGHAPHHDFGYDENGNPTYGMDWCLYSASVLHTTDYEGGEFVFVDDDDNEIEVVDKHKHVNHALIFDVSQKHKVNPHRNGERRVSLYFFAANLPQQLTHCQNNAKQLILSRQLLAMTLGQTQDTMEDVLLTATGRQLAAQQPPLIAKVLFKSCYQAQADLPTSVQQLFAKTLTDNPGWTLRYYSDQDAVHFLQEHFTGVVVQAFHALKPGAYKADLLRYCLLYIYGGMWSDLTQTFLVPLDELRARDTELVLVQDIRQAGVGGTYQAFIACLPRHRLLLQCVQFIVNAIRYDYMGANPLDITGPAMMQALLFGYDYNYTLSNHSDHICDMETGQKYISNKRIDHRATVDRPYYDTLWHAKDIYVAQKKA